MSDEKVELILAQGQSMIRHPGATASFAEVKQMAEAISKSGLFPVKSADAAMGLMLLCQAEGLHPIAALRRYHIIDGKPSMRADAMQAEFQAQGGKVVWGTRTADEVTATFAHPAGGQVTVSWTIEQARAAGLTNKDNWKRYPRQMLTARVVSEGVRTILPGIVAGIYTPEEVADFEVEAPPEQPRERETRPSERRREPTPTVEPTHPPEPEDPRKVLHRVCWEPAHRADWFEGQSVRADRAKALIAYVGGLTPETIGRAVELARMGWGEVEMRIADEARQATERAAAKLRQGSAEVDAPPPFGGLHDDAPDDEPPFTV